MDKHTARNMIAAYLTGASFDAQALAEAWRWIDENDPELQSFLREDFGGVRETKAACAMFLENLPYFADLSAAERYEQTPELAAHYRDCPQCRQAFWAVRPRWVNVAAAQTRRMLRTFRKEYAEAITLLIGKTGRLLESGFSPEPTGLATAAVLGGATQGEAAGTGHLTYDFVDAEEGLNIRVGVKGKPLSLVVEQVTTQAEEKKNIRLELRQEEDSSVYWSSAYPQCKGETVALEPGRWRLLIRREGVDLVEQRDVVLDLRTWGERK
ncbi:MAG: hypothetical protein P9L99_11220 [Candidatus Lernaella stagnicola]|nr:hypothetical protein [Candidatus Lernaella stagnicola]